MGGLTDNCKRRFVDLRAPFSPHAFPIPPHSDPSACRPLKKLKSAMLPLRSAPETTPPTPPASPPPTPPPRLAPAQPGPQNLAPLRRPVHGPQRIVKVFGHAGSGGFGGRIAPEVVGRRRELRNHLGPMYKTYYNLNYG